MNCKSENVISAGMIIVGCLQGLSNKRRRKNPEQADKTTCELKDSN